MANDKKDIFEVKKTEKKQYNARAKAVGVKSVLVDDGKLYMTSFDNKDRSKIKSVRLLLRLLGELRKEKYWAKSIWVQVQI